MKHALLKCFQLHVENIYRFFRVWCTWYRGYGERNDITTKTFFKFRSLTLCLLASSADNLYKQFKPRSGPTKRRA